MTNLLTRTNRPAKITLPDRPPTPLTPYTLTLLLAYFQYYTPELLPRGRFIAPSHLRVMAAWIGLPAPQLRSLRQHPFLAAHIALLHAMGFITTADSRLLPLPVIMPWLHASPTDHIPPLLAALQDAAVWQQTTSHLGLTDVLTLDRITYIQQQLQQQQLESASANSAPDSPPAAQWLPVTTADAWQLDLPETLPLWLQFDLRQFGDWSPGQPLRCTPLSIATATQRGYGEAAIQWILETAVRHPLSSEQQKQLSLWTRRAHAFQVQTVRLLTTAHHDHLKAILRQKRLRDSVTTQLSPHHAIVTTDMIPKLEQWLVAQNYPLWQPAADVLSPQTVATKPAEYHWLGLRLLIGLGDLFPLPYPAPHALLEDAAQSLSPETLADLEHLARQTLDGLQQAIRGRDAFFPAEQSPPAAWLEIIHKAIYHQTPLHLAYQPLGDRKPSWREVQPLRLEEQGALHYLHVYCYRAETNLTLRLDRIHELQGSGGDEGQRR
jgi:hypothetical protein